MNILHVIASVNPSRGGPSVCVPNLARAQARLGHETAIAVPADKDYAQYCGTLVERLSVVKDIPLIRIPRRRIGEQYFFGVGSRKLHVAISAADVVHVHGMWDPIVFYALRASRRAGKRYVITPHGMLNRWSLAQGAFKKRLVLTLLMKDLLAGSTFVHALNSNEERDIRTTCSRCGVSVFPNGIDLAEFDNLPPRGIFRSNLAALSDRPYALFLGRLHHVKGLDYLVDAFAQVAHRIERLDLVIAGPDDGLRAFVQTRIRELDLGSRVHLIGPLYGERKFAAILDALCLVQPSRQEGFSMSIAEALACGTPVVISQSCHFPEVAERGAGYVVPLDASSIADAICDLAQQPDRGSAMSEAAKRMIRDEYTWSEIARDMIVAYKRCEQDRRLDVSTESRG